MYKPSWNVRLTEFQKPEEMPKGLDAMAQRWIGRYHRRQTLFENIRVEALEVDQSGNKWADLGQKALRRKLSDCRQAVRRKRSDARAWRIETVGALRETARREVGLFPFVEQIMGVLALHQGFLAEMATGEGKTLTAVLAAIMAGWTGKPCHVVTVNDYLAQRDAQWYRKLYEFAGIRSASVTNELPQEDRRDAYAAEVVYTTSKEIVADFLRDRLVIGQVPQAERRHLLYSLGIGREALENIVQRGLHTVIVDEADSVLIDEAVTPLILSAPRENKLLEEACKKAVLIGDKLEKDRDYTVDIRFKEVKFTEQGRQSVEALKSMMPIIWQGYSRRMELVEQAITAREFYHCDREYIVEEDKVVIVDEYTGRPMPGRSWRQGLHQIIEAREGLELSDPTETTSRLSFQRFFRFFHHMSGMTGTGLEAAEELWMIYRLPVISIPTHKPVVREDMKDRVFVDKDAKWEAVKEEIKKLKAIDRPVLVGFRNIIDSNKVAALLEEEGILFQQLNAIHHKSEAQVIARAGQPGHVTLATNMAGRGTDIRLGQGVEKNGGLHVLGTERHDSGRVDRQLAGRCGRQGDPGSVCFFISLEDEIVKKYTRETQRETMEKALSNGDKSIVTRITNLVSKAQKKAEKDAFYRRGQVLQNDTWLDEALGFGGSGEGV